MQDHVEKMRADRNQLLFEAGILVNRREHIALDAGAIFGDHDLEEAGFSPETLVQRALGSADAFDDIVNGDLLVAALKKQWCNERDDLALALFGQPAAATRLRSFCDGANGASRDTFDSADEYVRHPGSA